MCQASAWWLYLCPKLLHDRVTGTVSNNSPLAKNTLLFLHWRLQLLLLNPGVNLCCCRLLH